MPLSPLGNVCFITSIESSYLSIRPMNEQLCRFLFAATSNSSSVIEEESLKGSPVVTNPDRNLVRRFEEPTRQGPQAGQRDHRVKGPPRMMHSYLKGT